MRDTLTLDEAVARYRDEAPDRLLFVGADGGGFFFIGTAEEYERAIDEVNAQKHQALQDTIKEFGGLMRHFPARLQAFKEAPVDPKDANSLRQFAADAVLIAKAARRMATGLTTADDLVKRLECYAHLRSREIKKLYPRLEGDGDVILIRGGERGTFWYKNEYDSGDFEYGYDKEK